MSYDEVVSIYQKLREIVIGGFGVLLAVLSFGMYLFVGLFVFLIRHINNLRRKGINII